MLFTKIYHFYLCYDNEVIMLRQVNSKYNKHLRNTNNNKKKQ